MNPDQKPISIDNLTAYQVEMLDAMWSLDSEQDYLDWFDLLDLEDQELAQGLQQLIILAALEQLLETELDQCCEAREYLKRFRLQ